MSPPPDNLTPEPVLSEADQVARYSARFKPVAPAWEQYAAPEQPEQTETLAEQTARRDHAAQAAHEARMEEQRALEQKYGVVGTSALKFSEGVLNLFTAGGALAGAAIEGYGSLLDYGDTPEEIEARGYKRNFVEQFGRDLGEAGTGKAALQALSTLPSIASDVTHSALDLKDRYTPEGAPFQTRQSHAASAWEHTEHVLEEQAKAWPLLSNVSKTAGVVTAAVVTGGLTGAHGAGLEMVGTGAGEGAMGGAQIAYEERAPLRDVLKSTLIGAGLGAAVGAGAEYIPKVISATRLRKAAGDLSESRTLSAMGFKASNVRQLAKDAEVVPEAIANAVETVHNYRFNDGTKLFEPIALRGGKPADYAAALARAETEVGEKLGAMRRAADDLIPAHPELAPNIESVARKIETEVVEKLENSPSHVVRDLADQLKPHVSDVRALAGEAAGKLEGGAVGIVKREASVGDLWELRRTIDDLAYAERGAARVSQLKNTPLGEQLERVRGIIEDEIDRSVSAASKIGKSGAIYKNVKRDFAALRDLKKVAYHAGSHDFGNNWFGLGSTVTGAATFAADVATGGGFSAIKAAGAAVAHKLIKERGSGYAALVSRAFARGEMKVGLGRFARLLPAEEQLAGKLLRNVAEVTPEFGVKSAQEFVRPELIGDLGGHGHGAAFGLEHQAGRVAGHIPSSGVSAAAAFGPREERPEIPMEVAGGREAQTAMSAIQRAQASVAAAEEAAGSNPAARQAARQAAQREAVHALAREAGDYNPAQWASKPPTSLQKIVYRPALLDEIGRSIASEAERAPAAAPVELEPERVRALSDDADGPAAIGKIQRTVDQAIEQAPQSEEGAVMRQELERVRRVLEKSDTPGAILESHNTIQRIRGAIPAMTDPVVQSYAERQATALETAMSSESFGSFGALYGLARTPRTEAFRSLSRPDVAREMLRVADRRGQLVLQVREQAGQAERSADAAAALSGAKAEPVKEFYSALEDRFAAAEDAVLLDGGPASRVTKLFTGRPSSKLTRELGDRPEQMVANAVRPRVERLLPVLYGEPEKGGKRVRIPPPLSRSERLSRHNGRLDQVKRAMDDLGEDFLADGLSGLDDEMQAETSVAVAQQLQALYADLPKPATDWRGRKSGLSDDDLRRGDAVWEATVDPLSILDDFRHGAVDPDKVAYVHANSPGIIKGAQAGVLDVLTGKLTNEQRQAIPENVLTQLDSILAFGGALQPSEAVGFSKRIDDAIAQYQQTEEDADKEAAGPLSLPIQQSLTERLASRGA
ncbi:MAG: hypothetical protein EPO32_14895 [Anaerolineae bacterium]|nr:MAG: hypothetical protein EPO32_14895 [Anaerolineae bacterium]